MSQCLFTKVGGGSNKTLTITKNGSYDVKKYGTANVNVNTLVKDYIFQSGVKNDGFTVLNGNISTGSLTNAAAKATTMVYTVSSGDGYCGFGSTKSYNFSNYDYVCIEYKGGIAAAAPSMYDYFEWYLKTSRSVGALRTKKENTSGVVTILDGYGPTNRINVLKIPTTGMTTGYVIFQVNRYNSSHTYTIYNIWLEKEN